MVIFWTQISSGNQMVKNKMADHSKTGPEIEYPI
jgi:hypothetical protein